jgi:cell wall-associated NlpC family hydrolase
LNDNNADNGFPGGPFDPWTTKHKCKIGFICYAFVARALADAGYSIDEDAVNTDYGCNYFLRYPEVSEANVRIGDIVLYSFVGQGNYHHVGIVSHIRARKSLGRLGRN